MKKIIGIMLVVVMLLAVVSACGAGDTTPAPADNTPAPADNTPAPADNTPAPADNTPAPADNTPADTTPSGTTPTEAYDEFPPMSVVESPKIAYLYDDLSYEDALRWYTWAHVESEQRGWETTYMEVTDGAEAIRSAWITANNQGYNAIVCPSMDGNISSYADLIEASRANGCGIYLADNDAIKGAATTVGYPAATASCDLFYAVADFFGYEFNCGITTAYILPSVWERTLAVNALLSNESVLPLCKLLAEESVDTSSTIALPEQVYGFVSTWIQKYGNELDAVFCAADADSMISDQAALTAGRTCDDFIIFTIGANPNAVAAMRAEESTIKYNYSMDCEYWMHFIYQLIDEIQVQGLVPGDGKCSINFTGGKTLLEGPIITKDNLPPLGSSITTGNYADVNNADWADWTTTQVDMVTWY